MARTATEVIDQAILENRRQEMVLYVFATFFVLTGMALISWCVYHCQTLFAAMSGFVEGALFVPAVFLARQTRRENMMVRMMEVPLSQVSTADEAAKMLMKISLQIFSAKTKAK